MIAYLDQKRNNKHAVTPPLRLARAQVIIQTGQGSGQLYEVLVNLDEGKVITKEHLPGKHSFIDPAYMQEAEKACRADARVQAGIAKLQLPEGATVCVEPWAYATDGMNDMSERTTMVR